MTRVSRVRGRLQTLEALQRVSDFLPWASEGVAPGVGQGGTGEGTSKMLGQCFEETGKKNRQGQGDRSTQSRARRNVKTDFQRRG